MSLVGPKAEAFIGDSAVKKYAGARFRERVEFTDGGTAFDPTTVRCTYQLPGTGATPGRKATITYGDDRRIVRHATGVYSVRLRPKYAGQLTVVWEAEGTNQETIVESTATIHPLPELAQGFTAPVSDDDR